MKKILILFLMLFPAMAIAQDYSAPTYTPPISDSGPRWFYKQGAAPTFQADRGVVYTKVNPLTGKVALYYTDDTGIETLVVPGGGGGPGAATWCGVSAAAHDGNDAGSYAAANAYCTTIGTCTAGHVCRLDEVVDLINQGSAFTGHGSQILWANAGGPGYTAYSTDCQGWTETSHTSPTAYTYGNTWDFTGAQPLPFVGYCTSSYKYACCQ